jgi:hypothetical protein
VARTIHDAMTWSWKGASKLLHWKPPARSRNRVKKSARHINTGT